MLISIIAAPTSAPQVSSVSPHGPRHPQLDRLDIKILESVRESGLMKVWSILNVLAEEEGPRNRAEGRNLRLHLLAKLQRLNRVGLVFFSERNLVSPVKPESTLTKMVSRRRKRTVRRELDFRAVSGDGTSASHTAPDPSGGEENTMDARNLASSGVSEQSGKTESAFSLEQVTAAARWLACLPRNKKRKWSGWIDGERCWRDRSIILPTGEIAFIWGVLRQKVVITRDRGQLRGGYFGDGGPQRWFVLPANDVRLFRNESAQLLGKLKKGVKEKPSPRKAATAQANGCRPCRPGKRRGRPRQRTGSNLEYSHRLFQGEVRPDS